VKISIITVSFNAEASIVATLLSVANQTYKNIEHIVIDGGSVDGTVDLVKQYGEHLTRFISEPDKGIYDAMNKGITLASGDIIGFLNADDIYSHPNILAQVARQMADVDACFGDVVYFSPLNPEKVLRRYSSARFNSDLLAWGCIPAHPTLFLKKFIYERFGTFNTSYRISGDFEFMARVFKGKEIKYRYIPEVLVKMGIGGISTRGLKSTILLNQEMLRACKENNINTNLFKLLSRYKGKLFEYINK
jgi:glycosyltransferase involved in cell wall biosynthesis